MKDSEIYIKHGNEQQHHVMWLVKIGLFETALYKEWMINKAETDLKWLLQLIINK